MQPITRTESTTVPKKHYSTGSVASQDGTPIGYRQLGHGPGLVVLHGTAESAQSHMELAEALADVFTVYLPDRRGRGLSGPYGVDYGIGKEVEDLDALLSKTGANFVFGVSVGAIVCLHAAVALPAVHKAAIFEPPFVIDGSLSTAFLRQYDEEIANGKVASALVTGMLGAQMGPAIFNVMPRRLLELLTAKMMAREEKTATSDDVTMRRLAPTLRHDFQLALDPEGALGSFAATRAEVLLLGGSKSPSYFKVALGALQGVFPDAKRIVFPGLGHSASGNANWRGKPQLVARELRRFFGYEIRDGGFVPSDASSAPA